MTVTSLTQLAAGSVQQSLSKQRSRLAASMQATASGNRINRAAQDVAALSVATGLSSEVTSLRSASLNIAQASSMLQVADGGLGQIGSIVDRMNALAVQANSGALSDAARKGLNTEFQAISDEINRLAGNTNFNGVNLLDGSLQSSNTVQTSAEVGGDVASGTVHFTALGAGDTVELNGQTLTAGTDFAVGGTVSQTVNNLAEALNDSDAFDGFSFDASGAVLNIEADVAGEAGNQFTIDQAASTATFTVPGGDALTGAGVFSLTGGSNDGLTAGDTTVSGSSNDSLIASDAGRAARSVVNFNDASDIQAGDTISIDDGEGGLTNFTFVNGTPATANEIQIGSTLEETLQNTANTLENFSGAGDFGTRQLDFSVEGNSLVIEGEAIGNPTDVNGTALDVALGTTGGTLSNATLSNGQTGAVDVSNVANSAFIGEIQGFEATQTGADQVEISVDVGGETYTATINDTTPNADTTVTFTSENGGSFDVTLAANEGQSVGTQADADLLANRFDTAFSGLEFSQQREVSSFEATGDFVNASVELSSSDFSNVQVTDVRAFGNEQGNSRFEVDINGQTFRADNLGDSIGVGETVTLTADNGDTLQFTNGNTVQDLSTNQAAEQFADNFADALNISTGDAGASFQVGSSSDGTVNLQIGNVTTEALFGGQSLDLLSAEGARAALAALSGGLNALTAVRADVGAFQQALDYASANVETAILNQEAARATLADTDIAEESTQTAQSLVQSQASIATLAQTNRMSGNLLQLLVQ